MGEDREQSGGVVAAVLRRVALVYPNEGAAAGWSAAFFFCVLGGYYMLRPIREAMGIAKGWDRLPWLITGTLLAMLLVNPLYAWLASRVPRRRFVPITYHVMAGTILVFFGLLHAVADAHRVDLGYAFYIWLSVFNLFATAVFWSVMADTWTPEQAKRLFAFIGVGGTLGAIVGAWAASSLVGRIGQANMMLPAAVFVELAVVCLWRLSVRTGWGGVKTKKGVNTEGTAGTEKSGAGKTGREPERRIFSGIAAVFTSPYLLLICAFMFLYSVLSTLLYMEQGRIVSAAITDEKARTALFAQIDLWVNIVTLAVQALLTGRLARWIGLGATLAIVPLVTVLGFTALLVVPAAAMLGTLVVFQVLRRGLNYAATRPMKETLYTIVSADQKYKSKSFIDTFVYRAGDQAGAWTPSVLEWAGKAAVVAVPVAAVAIPLAVASVGAAAALGWMYGRMKKD